MGSRRFAILLPLAALLALLPATAPAQMHVSGDIVCDNTFVLYSGSVGGESLEFHVGGAFPYATPVDFATPHPALYLVAWSDDAIHQGLLHDLAVDGAPRWSQDPAWTVFASGEDLDLDYPAAQPSAADLARYIARANAGELWQPVTVGGANDGSFPAGQSWEAQAPIAPAARWVWFNSGRQGSFDAPFRSGFDHGEVLVFRLLVDLPAPSEAETWSRVKRLFLP